MEIVGEDGCAIKLKDEGFKAVFGRGSGFNTKDRTVSRRHVLFQLRNQTEPRVSFEVIGKNPLWLRSGGGGGDGERKIRVFKKLEKGEIEPGDCFCISSQSPVWYNLKKIEVEEEEENDLGNDNGSGRLSGNSESLDISQIDPVKEFGFLVMGHEFDCYPKQRMRNPKNWDWFLEETKQGEDSDDEKKSGRSKRKKNEDDEWTDESEDMKVAAKINRVDRPKYSTRSKDKHKGKQRKEDHGRMKMSEDDEEDEDEDDDTLGGFIVTDEEEEENDEEEEEEEELMDDEEEEELDE